MLIQINTDKHIEASRELAARIESAVTGALDRFGERVTRVELHLKDENSAKGGEGDKLCAIEARLAGLQPIAASHAAPAADLAVDGALDKLERVIERAVARADGD